MELLQEGHIETATALRAVAEELSEKYWERSAVVRALVTAVLAGQHSLVLAAITASNELPSGEETAAIYDRLLVRLEVGYLADPSNFAALVRSAVAPVAPPRRTTVDLAGLREAAHIAVPAVGVPDGIVD